MVRRRSAGCRSAAENGQSNGYRRKFWAKSMKKRLFIGLVSSRQA
jgi:hypothetical protein